MKPIRDESGIAGFEMIDGTKLELFEFDEEFYTFFTTGPVIAFQVDDVGASRATIESRRRRVL